MKAFKKYLLIVVSASFFALFVLYISMQFFVHKVNQEITAAANLNYNIRQLKDRHILCMLDYKYNPNGKDIFKECKGLERDLIVTLDQYNKSTPLYDIYITYIK